MQRLKKHCHTWTTRICIKTVHLLFFLVANSLPPKRRTLLLYMYHLVTQLLSIMMSGSLGVFFVVLINKIVQQSILDKMKRTWRGTIKGTQRDKPYHDEHHQENDGKGEKFTSFSMWRRGHKENVVIEEIKVQQHRKWFKESILIAFSLRFVPLLVFKCVLPLSFSVSRSETETSLFDVESEQFLFCYSRLFLCLLLSFIFSFSFSFFSLFLDINLFPQMIVMTYDSP
jgi:hypothetical protein